MAYRSTRGGDLLTLASLPSKTEPKKSSIYNQSCSLTNDVSIIIEAKGWRVSKLKKKKRGNVLWNCYTNTILGKTISMTTHARFVGINLSKNPPFYGEIILISMNKPPIPIKQMYSMRAMRSMSLIARRMQVS